MKKSKKAIKKCLGHLRNNLGDDNTSILLAIVCDSCDYALGEKGLKNVRTIEVKFNNLHTTICNLKDFSYTH